MNAWLVQGVEASIHHTLKKENTPYTILYHCQTVIFIQLEEVNGVVFFFLLKMESAFGDIHTCIISQKILNCV